MRPAVIVWITLAMAAGTAGCGSQSTVKTVVSVTTVTATQAVPAETSTTDETTPSAGRDASSGRDLAGRVVLIDPATTVETPRPPRRSTGSCPPAGARRRPATRPAQRPTTDG